MDELALLGEADRRALSYLDGVGKRRVYPDADALTELAAFDEALPSAGFQDMTFFVCWTKRDRLPPLLRTILDTSALSWEQRTLLLRLQSG